MSRSRRSWADIDTELWPIKTASVLNVQSEKASVSPKIKSPKFHFLVCKMTRLSKHLRTSSQPSHNPSSENMPPQYIIHEGDSKTAQWQVKSPVPVTVVMSLWTKHGHLSQGKYWVASWTNQILPLGNMESRHSYFVTTYEGKESEKK